MNYKGFLEGLIHLIYPSLCIACQENDPLKGHQLCLPCLKELPFIQSTADSIAALEGKDFFPSDIDYFRSLFYYTKESIVAEMIHRMKYQGQYRIGIYLGKLLSEKMKEDGSWAGYQVVPVPLHKKRKISRGFNQAEKIARGIEAGLSIPLSDNILLRRQYHSSQTVKGKWERSRVLRESIEINSKKEVPKSVILVDDVVTTGSTVAACTNLLLESGTNKLAIVSLGVSV